LISVENVYNDLRKFSAKWKVLIIDACRDEPREKGLHPSLDTKGFCSNSQKSAASLEGSGLVLLSSCMEGQASLESEEFKHGVFTHYLLEGLSGSAGSDKDSLVSLHELYGYACKHTTEYVSKTYKDRRIQQIPVWSGTSAGDLAIAKVRRRSLF
jgi:uncharacterized caspase-like protein